MTNPSQPSDLRQRLNDLRIQPDHGVKHRRLLIEGGRSFQA